MDVEARRSRPWSSSSSRVTALSPVSRSRRPPDRSRGADAAEGAVGSRKDATGILAPVALEHAPASLGPRSGGPRPGEDCQRSCDALQQRWDRRGRALRAWIDVGQALVQDAVPHLERVLRGRVERVVGEAIIGLRAAPAPSMAPAQRSAARRSRLQVEEGAVEEPAVEERRQAFVRRPGVDVALREVGHHVPQVESGQGRASRPQLEQPAQEQAGELARARRQLDEVDGRRRGRSARAGGRQVAQEPGHRARVRARGERVARDVEGHRLAASRRASPSRA